MKIFFSNFPTVFSLMKVNICVQASITHHATFQVKDLNILIIINLIHRGDVLTNKELIQKIKLLLCEDNDKCMVVTIAHVVVYFCIHCVSNKPEGRQ